MIFEYFAFDCEIFGQHWSEYALIKYDFTQEYEAKCQDRSLGVCIYVKIASFWVKILVKRSDPAKNI